MSTSIHLRLEKTILKKLKELAGKRGITTQALLRYKIAEWLSGNGFLSDEENWSEYDRRTEKIGIHFRVDQNIFNQLEKIRKNLNFKNVSYLLRIKLVAWLAIPVFIDDGAVWTKKKKIKKKQNSLIKISNNVE